ncbi:hypothetical protein GCM10007047_08680 [Cerasicoccus arenae]|uniref:Uncharacterized protein n=2 Tax=Cerasicoccus arenae TaxID=424488 RepID=A0A8J3GDA2_9BACT|nr:hypothetical protein GCM10007047_08680 [Cerasicoccus arenae]
MIAMTIFVILAGGIISGVFTVRADAENNLYESSALNVAISFLEQAKSIDYLTLEAPPVNGTGKEYHTFIIGFGETLAVPLGDDVVINVPIISNAEGESKKELDVTVNITVTEATDLQGYWMEVGYSWRHPTSNRIYAGEVRGFRSEISTY